MPSDDKPIWGIVGGMGPLASAEFLKTIYEFSLGKCEQEFPTVILYSDPSFPDRTEEFLDNSFDVLLSHLLRTLHHLRDLGATRFVLCCVTIHHLLTRLPRDLQERIISLLDVALGNAIQSRERHLLICTSGTRRMEIFESHSQWELAKDFVVLPDNDDQQMIHNLIYQGIKKHGDVDGLISFLMSLLSKYRVQSCIAGCTEIHLLAKQSHRFVKDRERFKCIDPLTIIAREISEWKHQ